MQHPLMVFPLLIRTIAAVFYKYVALAVADFTGLQIILGHNGRTW